MAAQTLIQPLQCTMCTLYTISSLQPNNRTHGDPTVQCAQFASTPNFQNPGDISNKSLGRLQSEIRLTLCQRFLFSGCKLQHRSGQQGEKDHVAGQRRWQIPDL